MADIYFRSLATENSSEYSTSENITNINFHIQGDFESCADILTTSYWLHVELGKNI
jgi:hypothetical protein